MIVPMDPQLASEVRMRFMNHLEKERVKSDRNLSQGRQVTIPDGKKEPSAKDTFSNRQAELLYFPRPGATCATSTLERIDLNIGRIFRRRVVRERPCSSPLWPRFPRPASAARYRPPRRRSPRTNGSTRCDRPAAWNSPPIRRRARKARLMELAWRLSRWRLTASSPGANGSPEKSWPV